MGDEPEMSTDELGGRKEEKVSIVVFLKKVLKSHLIAAEGVAQKSRRV